MTALPAASEFTGSTVTEAQFKTAVTNMLSFLSGLLGSDGSAVTALSTLGALGGKIAAKTGAYTVLAADRGTVFHCSGTWTLTLTAAATMATGHSFAVINTGSGTITIDPNASELIDNATTKALTTGQSCIVTCDGVGFKAISGGGGDSDTVDGIHASTTAVANKLLALNASGVLPCSITGASTSCSGNAATATTATTSTNCTNAVTKDHGHNNVGSFCFAAAAIGMSLSPGATTAGSNLRAAGLSYDDNFRPYNTASVGGNYLSGTWRCLGEVITNGIGPFGTMFQRIA